MLKTFSLIQHTKKIGGNNVANISLQSVKTHSVNHQYPTQIWPVQPAMGNSLAICFTRNQASTKINKNRSSSSSHSHSLISPPYNFSKSTSQRLDKVPPKETSATRSTLDDDYIKEQARVAAALLLQHHHQNGTLTQFGRSVSLRDPLASSKKQKRIPRSSSSRPRLLSDSLPQHLEILNQVLLLSFPQIL